MAPPGHVRGNLRTYDREQTARDGGGGDDAQDDDLQQCLGTLVPAQRDQQLSRGRAGAGALTDGHCDERMRRCGEMVLTPSHLCRHG